MRNKPGYLLRAGMAGAAYLLHLHGPLDASRAARLRLRLLVHLATGCKKVILDLKRVPYIDSDGLRALEALRTDWHDVPIELRNANKRVRRTLSLVHLDRLLAPPAPIVHLSRGVGQAG